MSQTINDFRDFFKPSKEKISFSIKAIIHEIYSMLEAQYKVHGMRLTISKEDETNDMLLGFPSEFKQVVMNLLNNTKDALIERAELPEYQSIISGDVAIAITNENDRIIMDYHDCGGGIPDDVLSNMFKPYNTTKGKSGMGVGMYMAHHIITHMGGAMSVKNHENGAWFQVTLPQARA